MNKCGKCGCWIEGGECGCPDEPITEEMLEAGRAELSRLTNCADTSLTAIYRAMRAKAPKPDEELCSRCASELFPDGPLSDSKPQWSRMPPTEAGWYCGWLLDLGEWSPTYWHPNSKAVDVLWGPRIPEPEPPEDSNA